MLIFVLDDEKYILENTRDVIAQVAPDAEIMTFTRAALSLDMIQEQGIKPDIAFCDIEMPGLSGLQYAAKLKSVSPETRIVFVTAYPQYALDAFKVRAQGYILKPLQPDQIKEELMLVPGSLTELQGKLEVRCFGTFSVSWQGKPLTFARNKSMGLLAYLVDAEGAWCKAGDIISNLWEDAGDDKKQYLRVLSADLLQTLRQIGMEQVLLKKRGQLAVDTDFLDCDYYRMLEGDMQAVNAYAGEYMKQYSWAELTGARLFFRKKGEIE